MLGDPALQPRGGQPPMDEVRWRCQWNKVSFEGFGNRGEGKEGARRVWRQGEML